MDGVFVGLKIERSDSDFVTSCFTEGFGELDLVGGEDFDSSLLRQGVG